MLRSIDCFAVCSQPGATRLYRYRENSREVEHLHFEKEKDTPETMSGSEIKVFFSWRSALLSTDLDAKTKLTALVISTHMNEWGTGAWPSQETIAVAGGFFIGTATTRGRLDGFSVAVRPREYSSIAGNTRSP